MTPVTRRDIVIGKWMATSAFGLGALGLNIAGLIVVLASRAPATLSVQAATLASWALLGLAPLALLGASVELLVAGVSRTMKEASTSLLWVVFTPMIAGMLLLFFPVTGDWWSAVPLIGQQVVIGAGMSGAPVPLLQILVLAAVTTLSALVPLAAVERVLSRDDVVE
jgi:ABC-type Na+ efflux pump permease subunit